ncbi:tRNA preQ1(34) S-adenosylmethionine ribosyltransferase-isomerase QueA [Nitratireductor sp. GISD-1A_MAKvit]|uniref:tRNA preQ1(34) S-adenosylmethionine ribosyltransferase-isomerase QueA n=1 Tax=Nitratireductor sp. GISD-1A_MAKvit TaxID=3234198 RepID=UPI00346670C0
MRVDLFDFDLPEERIALRPANPRDSARLMKVEGKSFDDHVVRELPGILRPGDALVFNDTKVIPARLGGVRRRGEAQARIEATLHMREGPDRWRAFLKPAKRVNEGERIQFGHDGESCFLGMLEATVAEKGDGGEALLVFDFSGPVLDEAIAAAGHMPLPPYIAGKRAEDERDETDYQTIYAREEGAVAAPTAGLHFTPELMQALDAAGIERYFVTLHVGAGTFLPVKVEDTDDHRMHAEWGDVDSETADALNAVRKRGGRIVSVGTTSLRLLESASQRTGTLEAWSGATDIFITPGYRFRTVDVLMTNFHLPRSTLFMLVSAFCGTETMKRAYEHAIRNEYRFYSYGDASLLFREDQS